MVLAARVVETCFNCRTSDRIRSSTALPKPIRYGSVARHASHISAWLTEICFRTHLQVFTTKQFIEKSPEDRASIMRTFTETEIEDVEAAIAVMPHFDIEYQAFVKVNATGS